MRFTARLGILAATVAAALAAQPSLAQNSAAEPAIGPDQLRDFTLNGTVTRRPAAPAATATQPARTTTPPSERRARTAATTSPPARSASTAPETAQPNRPAAGTVTVALPPPAPSPETAPPLETQPQPRPAVQAPPGPPLGSQPGLTPVELPPGANEPIDDDWLSFLPWFLAALVLGIGAAVYAWRQRGRPAYATAGPAVDMFAPRPTEGAADRPPPRPSAPAGGAPAPPASPPVRPGPPVGIVSTRLRPWIEIEFSPIRCIVTEDRATVEFEVAAFNSGAAPAREVLLEACMFNAGPDVDEQIRAFFANPVGRGERIPAISQLKRVPFKSAVSLPFADIRALEIEGRRLFVPLIGINAIYSWSAGNGQTSASYLVGRETDAEKMAPFRLDLGARQFRGLSARQHAIAVRK